MTKNDRRYDALWRFEKARFPLPAVVLYHGSVWQRMVWGLTRRHAEKRAVRQIARLTYGSRKSPWRSMWDLP